jgi:hypothetical protein
MILDEATTKFNEIFCPGLLEEFAATVSENRRFVYYTSADTAMKVFKNHELWFRNATVMNDFSEISYGLDLIRKTFSDKEGERFREVVEGIFVGTIDQAGALLSDWEFDWKYETYMACVSVHDPDEDTNGRLSMWRAYGDVAIVVNNGPMMVVTDNLGVFSTPVLYLSETDFEQQLSGITDAILKNKTHLQALGQQTLVSYIHHMLQRFAISTKHPGFKEEQEWRLFYRPTDGDSPGMTKEIVVLDGTPQKIYKLSLANNPEKGLYQADLPSLINRVIVGPMKFPFETANALVEVLREQDVQEASQKVVVSDIPLRIR